MMIHDKLMTMCQEAATRLGNISVKGADAHNTAKVLDLIASIHNGIKAIKASNDNSNNDTGCLDRDGVTESD